MESYIETKECDCAKPDVEEIQDCSNMWYHGVYIHCYYCKKSTEYFSHNGDQNSGTDKARKAWRAKEFAKSEEEIYNEKLAKAYLDFNRGHGHPFEVFEAGFKAGYKH